MESQLNKVIKILKEEFNPIVIYLFSSGARNELIQLGDCHLSKFFVSLQYNLGYNKNILVYNLLDRELI